MILGDLMLIVVAVLLLVSATLIVIYDNGDPYSLLGFIRSLIIITGFSAAALCVGLFLIWVTTWPVWRVALW